MDNREVAALTPILVTGMKNRKGFTLIEMLVVLVIIGLIIGGALLAFGDFGRKRHMMMAAEQFVNDLIFVQQEALLETTTLGVKIDQNGYQVWRFQAPNDWQPMVKHTIHQRYFRKNLNIWLEQQSQPKHTPQIIINAAGEMTPFILHFGDQKEQVSLNVVGKQNGTLSLQPLISK